MSKHVFFNDLRQAFAWPAARVDADHPAIRSHHAKNDMTLWLSPKWLDAFRPGDFADLDLARSQELEQAVRNFANIAREVPADAPPTSKQWEKGKANFDRLLAVVRPIIVEDWLRILDALFRETEAWCQRRDWPCKRKTIRLQDDFLGSYDAPQLFLFALDRSQILLKPVARFVTSADGLVDMLLLPTCESALLIRLGETWQLRPDLGRRRAWNEKAFVATIEQLSQAA